MHRRRSNRPARLLVALALAMAPLPGQQAPTVTRLVPAHLATEVDAGETTTLEIHFDQPMRRGGHSFCGGGPQFPRITAPPRWKDRQTMVVQVALQPDHTYRLSLNCPAASNFRSARGVPLRPTPWTFTTLPAALRDPAVQRARNAAAFDALVELLPAKYSYYEHRRLDWPKLLAAGRAAAVAARTDRGWAAAVGRMLRPANDIHLYLRVGDQTVATASRRVDPLYRAGLLGKYLTGLQQPTRGVRTGRTTDGLAYLFIGGWSGDVDFAAVEAWIAGQRDAKAMILDVRANSGGAENLARQVARWFVKGVKVYAKHATRRGPGAANFFPVSHRTITGKPDGERFDKPVAVLMSRYCMSSCEGFLLMMRQAERCTLIGQRSFGSSGNPKPHALPNGVEILLPSWKVLRLDGTCFEGEGLAPDLAVEVDAADLTGRDPILEAALRHLRAGGTPPAAARQRR